MSAPQLDDDAPIEPREWFWEAVGMLALLAVGGFGVMVGWAIFG